MGKQTGFYAVDEDFVSLLEVAEALGLMAIPQLVSPDSLVEAVPPTKFQVPEPPRYFYLIPGELATVEAFYTELSNEPDVSMLDPLNSPVIECGSCERRGNRLFNSRIYLATDSSSQFYPIVNRKFEGLARRIKKWERTDRFKFYVGPKTAGLARKWAIILMHHKIELHVADGKSSK